MLATECLVGGLMGALRLPPFVGIMAHLGYPAYFMTIVGAWYVLAGLDPAIFAGLAIAFWALRPPDRRDLTALRS